MENSVSTANKKKVFIVTGIGRSGTSLVANFLQSGGVFIGDRVPKADSHNQYGYFEDLDFIHFHEKILARHGLNYFANPEKPITLSVEEINIAKELIKSRAYKQFWGWKDPRTCFFLDFWDAEIPEANFIFLFRHPIEVFLSQIKSHPWTFPSSIFDAWIAYNERILQFYKEHSGKAVLCNIHGLLQDLDGFENALTNKLGMKSIISKNVYRLESIHCLSFPESLTLFFYEKFPHVMCLYDKLQNASDMPFKISSNSLNEDLMRSWSYIYNVLNSVINGQIEQHQQLQKEYQQLLEKHEALLNRKYIKYILAMETIVKRIINKFL